MTNNWLNGQLRALKEQNDSLVEELEKEKSTSKQSQRQLGDLQEENEVLKARATTSSEAVEKLELRVSELTREKESLGSQLETVLERQKVFQEQDGIAQAELRILRQQLSELSKTQDVAEDATAEEQKLQSALQALQRQLASQKQDTTEELKELQERVLEMTRQQRVIDQQEHAVGERLTVLGAQLAGAEATSSGRGDGANVAEVAEFLLNDNKMLQEKVAGLQQLCDKQKEELSVTRRKMAWLRKSRQVTFADELKQSESVEGSSPVVVDAADEDSEEVKKLKHISDCHAAQLAHTEAVLETKVDLLIETEERCASIEADHDEVASKYAGLMEKHRILLKELQHHQAELANEQSRVAERDQLLKERQAELVAVKDKLREMKASHEEMCEKRRAEEKSVVDTEAELLSKSYLLNEAEERLSQLEAISREVTKDLTERVKEHNAGLTSHEELIIDLRAQLFAEQERVAETDKALAEKDRLLRESSTDLKKLEERYRVMKEQQETSVSAMDERLNSQVTEMKRKCIAKVKSVQAEYEAKLSESATALSVTKTAADAQVNKLENVAREQEAEIETLKTRLRAVESDLEEQTSEIQLKLERSREQLTELESQLADTDKCKKEALDAQADQLNRESGERLADLKRRAETRLGQIKQQLQADKESAIGELNRVADELRARLAACEDELHEVRSIM